MKKLLIMMVLMPLMAFADAVSSGLVAHYKFDGTLADSSGYGYDLLALNKNLSYCEGHKQGAASAVRIANNRLYSINDYSRVQEWLRAKRCVTNTWTMACWFKTDKGTALKNESTSGITGADSSIQYLYFGGSCNIAVGNNGINVFEHHPYFLPATVRYDGNLSGWHHLAVTIDGRDNAFLLYVDGKMVRQGVRTRRDKIFEIMGGVNDTKTEGLGIGGGYYGSSFDGCLDDFRIYSRALSAAEVQAIYDDQVGDLVAHYKFDGNADDSSGYGNDGVVHGATLATDRFGKANGAYKFDGNDWIEAANSVSLQSVTSTMTFSAWVKLDASSINDWIPMLCKGMQSRQFGFELARNAIEDRIFINDRYGTGSGQDVYVNLSRGSILPDVWCQYVATYDGREMKGYIDGVCVGTVLVSDSFAANDSALYLGKDVPVATEYFKGLMDDIRIYNRALSVDEVKALYDSEKPAEKGDLVAHYKFDGNADDSSGNNNHLKNAGEAVLTQDRYGKCNGGYHFSGANASRLVERERRYGIADTFSCSLWFRTSVPMSEHGTSPTYWNPGNDIVHAGNMGDSGAGVGLRVGTDGIAVVEHANFYRPSVLTHYTSIGTGWHHAVLVVENSGAPVVYLDGKYLATGQNDGRVKYFTFEGIGGGTWGNYTGDIDEMKVFNRVLSAADVKKMYDAEKPAEKGRLAAWYKFDGNLNDSSGLGYDLQVDEGETTPRFGYDRFGFRNRAAQFDGNDSWGTYHTFEGPDKNRGIITNTFAVVFWFKTHNSYLDCGKGKYWNNGNYALFPENGGVYVPGAVGLGIKVGRDGLEVVEHSNSHMPTIFTVKKHIGEGWNCVGMSVSHGRMSLFLNGRSVGGCELTHDVIIRRCGIGGGCYGYYTGKLDDIRFFDRALSADEFVDFCDAPEVPVDDPDDVIEPDDPVVEPDDPVVPDSPVVEPDDPVVPDSPVVPVHEDEPMDASVANTYDGIIVDADGLPMGYICVKTAKATNKGVSKVTATIQMADETKKLLVSGTVVVSDATMTQVASDGRTLSLSFSRNELWGSFDGFEIEGSRNLLSSAAKSDIGTTEKNAAEATCAMLKGNYVLAYGDEYGWNGLSVMLMAKGKVKVSGKLANGASVATTSQLVVGSEWSVVPVILVKKDVSVAFNVYFANDGTDSFVLGEKDAIISPVGSLDTGLAFYVGETVFNVLGDDYDLLEDSLPYGISVEPTGKKWMVANGAGGSDNPSALKLTFNAKAGTFAGSFKVRALNATGVAKSFTATVSGVVIEGCGYGTATIRGFGSFAVTIE